jgi:inositol phosphorylceramide mannosyltransferase catalytic subunit
LRKFGGVYVDADSECVSSLTDELLHNVGFAAHENEYVRPGLIGNSVIGTHIGCALMSEMMARIAALPLLASTASEDVWKITGPLAFTRALGQGLHTGYCIYPSFLFYPEHCTGARYSGKVDRCYARQFWGSTKLSAYSQFSVPEAA